jgi:gliding motility-associated-like protein
MVRNIILILFTVILYTLSAHGQVSLEPACAESIQQYGVTGFEDSEFVWSFDAQRGEVIEGNSTDTIVIRWGYTTGRIQLEVLEITSEGCTDVPSEAVFNIIAPYVDLGYDFPEICDQDTLTLDVGDFHFEPYDILWSDGSTGQYYKATTTEEIWVRVIDGYGCTRYDTISLLVNELPIVRLGNDTVLCDETEPLVLYPGDFAEYHWSSNVGEFTDSYLDVYPSHTSIDTIKLSVVDYNECLASDSLILFPCDISGLFKEMPNTITPNGDGDNDVWNIPLMENFPDAKLEIFDRWGRLVYRTTNVAHEPWDGTSKGKDLPMDAYYFILELNLLHAQPVLGTVNLIR